MPGTNWRVAPGDGEAAAAMEGGNWRTQLPPGSRHRIVYKIMEKMRRYHPLSGQEDSQDLGKTAVGFEEDIYATATSQSDYLRKISLKMLHLEMKSQKPLVNSLLSNAASNSSTPQDPMVAAGMDGSNWRVGVQPVSRQRIVNKIVETLKRHLPFSGEEGLQELKNIALRFEQHVYSGATSQSDYLRKISLKMLALEEKSHNPMGTQSNAASSSRNPQIPGNAPVF